MLKVGDVPFDPIAAIQVRVMARPGNKTSWIAAGLLAVLIAVGLYVWQRVPLPGEETPRGKTHDSAAALSHASDNAIELSPKVVTLGGIKTVAATEPKEPRQLVPCASLAIDPNRLAHVHSRFGGQVVEIGKTEDSQGSLGAVPTKRPLTFTDHVSEGQRLAVLWSKDLGEKKSELVDAQARLQLDQVRLSRLKEFGRLGLDRRSHGPRGRAARSRLD